MKIRSWAAGFAFTMALSSVSIFGQEGAPRRGRSWPRRQSRESVGLPSPWTARGGPASGAPIVNRGGGPPAAAQNQTRGGRVNSQNSQGSGQSPTGAPNVTLAPSQPQRGPVAAPPGTSQRNFQAAPRGGGPQVGGPDPRGPNIRSQPNPTGARMVGRPNLNRPNQPQPNVNQPDVAQPGNPRLPNVRRSDAGRNFAQPSASPDRQRPDFRPSDGQRPGTDGRGPNLRVPSDGPLKARSLI